MKQPAIYIMFNYRNGTLYGGVSSNLSQRVPQHKDKSIKSFCSQHGCDKLGYYELYNDIETAILREKQIKAGSRKKKIELIESMNPDWIDLYEEICK